MKITFILPYASLSGGTRVVAKHAEKLVEAGHHVTVISQPRKLPSFKSRLLKGFRKERQTVANDTPLLGFLGSQHIVLNTRGPIAAADVPDADVIIATWWTTAEWVAALPASKGRKYYFLQGYEMFDYLPKERVAATFELSLRKLAVSGYIRDMLVQHHGVKDVTLVPNAIDLAQFAAPERSKNTPLRIGFLYSPLAIKQTDLAIEASILAREAVPDLQLRCFGSVVPKAEMSLPDWADYHMQPDQSQIPDIYASCDLWLFTSASEGFGLPLLEAMACRTPVLATRAGAAGDLITGENGVLLENDPQSFAEQIEKFAAMSDETWEGYSQAAHQTAQSYNWNDASLLMQRALQAPASM